MKRVNVFEVSIDDLMKVIGGLQQAGEPESNPFDDESALDVQEGGDHYKKMGAYQPWEVSAAWLTPEELKGAMKFTVITYLAREADKGGMGDIRKAAHTMQIYLELEARRTAQQRPDGADDGGCSGNCENCTAGSREEDNSWWMRYDPVDGSPFIIGPQVPDEYRAHHGAVAWLYNPWTGEKRDPRDIGTDVHGYLIVPPKAA